MKIVVSIFLGCLVALARASGIVNVHSVVDDGQWHGEGLLESQDLESLHVAPLQHPVVAARAVPLPPPVIPAPAVPFPPPVVAARAVPLPPPVVPAPGLPFPSPVVAVRALDDGQWHGEGLLESQDWAAGHVAPLPPVVPGVPLPPPGLAYNLRDDDQWHGEGLLESQDLERHGIVRLH
ncbi:formin-2-like [Agrilus planipennis]|uniref:Formin-2-like n=1 Tax=Agrilus planipennis TaxID=224129 RepID=A0A1W4XN19_AGRPL|nr:formin-2-like [Agrilus planipennis]